jgi:hypothetical protein
MAPSALPEITGHGSDADNHGLTGSLQGASLGLNMTLASFAAISLTSGFEVFSMAWWSFRKHKGLYFWLINAAALGTIVYTTGLIIKFYALIDNVLAIVAVILIAWVPMVTGQSLVMYSRLHLIMRDARKVRWVLYMICTVGVCFHVPTAVLMLGVSLIQSTVTNQVSF